MATGLVSWSQTAANNASADSTVNWAEGQAPSSINDSARATMASAAKYRDDIAGAIATSGSSTAYTLSSFQGFGSLSAMHQQIIAFTPHTTCGATVTLNVDSNGAKPLRSAPSVELQAGTLIQGTPYVALYNNTDGAFYLHGLYGNPYNIPLAGGLDYWGSTAPNSSFAFPVGQAISRTTYATLFALVGTNFGTGDGSTTFNLPDVRGRVTAALDNLGGSDAARLSGSALVARTTMGGAGGEGTHTLTTTEMPVHNHSVSDPGHVHTLPSNTAFFTSGAAVTGGTGSPINPVGGTTTAGNTTGITIQNAGSGAAHNVVQPTIMCSYIMRII